MNDNPSLIVSPNPLRLSHADVLPVKSIPEAKKAPLLHPIPEANTLSVAVVYTGVADSRLKERNLHAHVWTDSVPLPQCDGTYCTLPRPLWEDIKVGETQTIPVRDGHHLYVAVFEDRAADDDGSAHPTAVQGERRAQAVLDLDAIRSGATMKATLTIPEAGNRKLGHVTAWIGVRNPHVDEHVPTGMKLAFKCGKQLALRNAALPNVLGLTEGMKQLETNYWNSPEIDLPGFMISIGMPKGPETPDFVEACIRAAGCRRGIADDRITELAAVALDDTRSTGKECPCEGNEPHLCAFLVGITL